MAFRNAGLQARHQAASHPFFYCVRDLAAAVEIGEGVHFIRGKGFRYYAHLLADVVDTDALGKGSKLALDIGGL